MEILVKEMKSAGAGEMKYRNCFRTIIEGSSIKTLATKNDQEVKFFLKEIKASNKGEFPSFMAFNAEMDPNLSYEGGEYPLRILTFCTKDHAMIYYLPLKSDLEYSLEASNRLRKLLSSEKISFIGFNMAETKEKLVPYDFDITNFLELKELVNARDLSFKDLIKECLGRKWEIKTDLLLKWFTELDDGYLQVW